MSKLDDALKQLGYKKLVELHGHKKRFKEGNYTPMQVEAYLEEETEWWPGTMGQGPTSDEKQVFHAQTNDGNFKIRDTYGMYSIEELLEELLEVA